MKPVIIVQGGAFGSEAKGAIAAYLCVRDNVEYAVRTGSSNAGHTVEYEGQFYVNQSLPVGWVNPATIMVLGAGALIDPAILDREIRMIAEATQSPIADVQHRVFIDYRAYIHRPIHAARSAESGRHHAMGATGKGCSEALMDRIRDRGNAESDRWRVRDYVTRNPDSLMAGCTILDTEALLNHNIDAGARILLEGTQGTALDLYLGPYPFTTHKQCGPAQWMMEAGLSPRIPTDIVMVIRTYPIRVAGNSGPLANETSWPTLARMINDKRERADLDPIVADWAIHEFECAVREAAQAKDTPPGSDGLDQHMWSSEQRDTYRVALSELNAAALRLLPADTLAELRKLFEVTTVTKKLRRIGGLWHKDLADAARQVRPTQIAVTFMNYAFPERWGGNAPPTDDEVEWLEDNINSVAGGSEVTLINRGRKMSEIVEVE